MVEKMKEYLKAPNKSKNSIKEYIKNMKMETLRPTIRPKKWLESETRQIIKILQLDHWCLSSNPIIMPKKMIGLSTSHEEEEKNPSYQVEKIENQKNKEIELEN